MSCHGKSSMVRRQFLRQTTSCGAYVAGLMALSPLSARQAMAQIGGDVVAREKWGRIEKLHDQLWALVSTFDSGDYTTVCNGGIIAGEQRVLAIETFMRPQGAQWLADWSVKLTGRWPTDVVVTHFHADHSAGVAGYKKDGGWPRLWLTDKTESLIRQGDNAPELPEVSRIQSGQPHTLDLGGRTVAIEPRMGHTASDLTIEVSDPNVIWAGDLFFNRMVPNYGDAIVKVLHKEVDNLVRERETMYVPGHGPVANAADLNLYRDFLQMMEQSVRKAFNAGKPAETVAKEFKLPKKFEDWIIFSDQVMPRAVAAWYRALKEEQ